MLHERLGKRIELGASQRRHPRRAVDRQLPGDSSQRGALDRPSTGRDLPLRKRGWITGWARWTVAGAALIAMRGPAVATTFVSRVDNAVSAVMARTGEVLWTHRPPKMSSAHYEAREQGLIVYPNYEGDDRSNPIFLDRATGQPTPAMDLQGTALAARSRTLWPPPPVVLDNGWVLTGFSPGNSQDLVFNDTATGGCAWRLRQTQYPKNVRAWKRTVLFAWEEDDTKPVEICAYEAGSGTALWRFDVGSSLPTKPTTALALNFEVLDDELYAHVDDCLFTLSPATGELRWSVGLARDLGLTFARDFWCGGFKTATFAKEGDILLLAYERRLLAIDLKSRECLWHLDPGSFPSHPMPLLHDGVAYFTSGPGRSAAHVGGKLDLVTYMWGFRTRDVKTAASALVLAATGGLALVLHRRRAERRSTSAA